MGILNTKSSNNNSIALNLSESAVDRIFKECVVKENSTNKSSHILFKKEHRIFRR